MKLCIYCKHYSFWKNFDDEHWCNVERSRVTGKPVSRPAEKAREACMPCGIDGRLWEPMDGA